MAGSSSQGIFLSYRREDAAPYARLLQRELRDRMPEARVFMDLDSIEAGADFAQVIREALGSCAVLVALIGRQWGTLADADGNRRLDNPDDFVRFEVQTALERGMWVIPVLVDDARPPQQQELPPELSRLARLNAFELSYGRYDYDADRLLELIQRGLAAVPRAGLARQDRAPADAGTLAARPDAPSGRDRAAAVARRLPARTARLVDDAVQIAQAITQKSLKASTLAGIAAALLAADPHHAAALLTDAEVIAQSSEETRVKIARNIAAVDANRAIDLVKSVENPAVRGSALAEVAWAMAGTYPDRAIGIAQSLVNPRLKVSLLAHIATELAAVDPGRAARLIADAERVAQSIARPSVKNGALADLARAQAATDPSRAERLALSIDDDILRATALAAVAGAVAATRPDIAARLADQAETVAGSMTRSSAIARFVTGMSVKDEALAKIVVAIAATDLDRAERIAGSIVHKSSKDSSLASIAAALAAADPDRAERTAQSIASGLIKSRVLASIAEALAKADPDRAERITRSIPDTYLRARTLVVIATS